MSSCQSGNGCGHTPAGENRHSVPVLDPVTSVPRIPASAGALVFDAAGRLLILKPNYKKGWTVPGGQVQANGESPWEACQRETLEECGLQVEHGRLVCVDFLRPKPKRPGGVRFLFDCGTFTDDALSTIKVSDDEIDEYRFAKLIDAVKLLSGPVRRRVAAAAGVERCIYLEEGRPLAAVPSSPGQPVNDS